MFNDTMFGEMSPLMDQFEKVLPNNDRPWRRVNLDITVATMQESASTATVTKSTMFLGPNPVVEKKRESE